MATQMQLEVSKPLFSLKPLDANLVEVIVHVI